MAAKVSVRTAPLPNPTIFIESLEPYGIHFITLAQDHPFQVQVSTHFNLVLAMCAYRLYGKMARGKRRCVVPFVAPPQNAVVLHMVKGVPSCASVDTP